MWGGVDFFVSIDVLLSFGRVDDNLLEGRPGKPQQRSFRQDGRVMVVTSFPNASFFLETLKGTGNRVYVLSEWATDKTTELLHLFGWQDVVNDVRCLTSIPGANRSNRGRHYTLVNVGCEPLRYSSSVLLVRDLSSWSPLLASQLVLVNHDKEVFSSPSEGPLPSVVSSMELLYALCHCITLAEWRVRYPGTSIAACTALSTSTLLSFCRFFIPAEQMQCEMVLQLSAHGATLVSDGASATHIITDLCEPLPPRGSSGSSSPGTSSATSSPVSSSSVSNASFSSSSSDSASSEEGGGEEGESFARAGAQAKAAAPSPSPPPTPYPQCERVTRGWVRDCCSALRLLPPPVDAAAGEAVAAAMRTAGVLLSILLPPEDARPLSLEHFVSIAKTYHFETDFLLADSLAEMQERLLALFRGVLRVRLVVAEERRPARGPAGARAELPKKQALVLCRYERKRDREAVATHLRLLALQFGYSIENLTRERRLASSADAGTQTAAPRFAHAGVGTDPSDAGPRGAKGEVAPSRERDEGVKPESHPETLADSESVDAEEWRHQLKNPEGKLLKSKDASSEDAKQEAGVDRDDASSKEHGDGSTREADPSAFSPTAWASTPAYHLSGSSTATHPPPTQDFPAFPLPVAAPHAAGGGTIFTAPPPFPSGKTFSAHAAASSSAGSIFAAPPPGLASTSYAVSELPQGRRSTTAAPRGSIFPMPENFPPPTAEPPGAPPETASAVCDIPTFNLSFPKQIDLLRFLKSMPLFSTDDRTYLRVHPSGIHCVFASAKEAENFARLQYILHDGVCHPIFPVRDAPPRSGPPTWKPLPELAEVNGEPADPQEPQAPREPKASKESKAPKEAAPPEPAEPAWEDRREGRPRKDRAHGKGGEDDKGEREGSSSSSRYREKTRKDDAREHRDGRRHARHHHRRYEERFPPQNSGAEYGSYRSNSDNGSKKSDSQRDEKSEAKMPHKRQRVNDPTRDSRRDNRLERHQEKSKDAFEKKRRRNE